MEKELVFVSSQPNDLQFVWQLEIQLHNFKKLGILDKYDYHITVWNNTQRNPPLMFADEWADMQLRYQIYPRVKFFFYSENKGELVNCIVRFHYASLVRPWVLTQHFLAHPELKDKALFYLDQDVLFTRFPDFIDKLKDDDINYLSDTRSYIAASYFDSKIKDVIPERLEGYKQTDPLQECLNLFRLNREVADKNEMNSGGAQYILKNIDHHFWENIFKQCIDIKTTLASVNRRFFESEDKGFQSWCADMWAILWSLWAGGRETRVPKEMDFAWATDVIAKLDTVYLFHNAGVTPHNSLRVGENFNRLFYKGTAKYVNNTGTPFEDDHSHVSEDFCSYFYVKEMEETRQEALESVI